MLSEKISSLSPRVQSIFGKVAKIMENPIIQMVEKHTSHTLRDPVVQWYNRDISIFFKKSLHKL